jgi:hypothetical protein
MPTMNDLDGRLYGMMQYLMATAAQHGQPDIPEPRGVVQLQDALDAVLQIAAVIDSQADNIPADVAKNAAAFLMIIRDYIKPLPRGTTEDGGPDPVTPDLQEKVGYLHQTAEWQGVHG